MTGSMAAEAAPGLRAIYDEHFDFVWRSLRRLGLHEDDIPDAVQDVFLIVHRKLATFRGESKMTTWLFGISMRVAADRRRRAHVRREVVTDTLPEQADPNSDVMKDVAAREGAALLEEILEEMSPKQRTVFVLFELHGVPCEEISTLMGVPLGTVYSRLRLARECFRRSIDRRQAGERFHLREVGAT
ncbi:MAG: RNA polymerase sigma factor [Polyangiaceae bacterium]